MNLFKQQYEVNLHSILYTVWYVDMFTKTENVESHEANSTFRGTGQPGLTGGSRWTPGLATLGAWAGYTPGRAAATLTPSRGSVAR